MARSFEQPSDPHQGSRGSALLVALPLLLIVTILGITGMRSVVLQERMAGNMRDRNLALQAAEAALREGERAAAAAARPRVTFRTDDIAMWEGLFTDPSGGSIAYATAIAGLAEQPRYFVEELQVTDEDTCPPGMVCSAEYGALRLRTLYRITARGVGGSPDAVVVLQSTAVR